MNCRRVKLEETPAAQNNYRAPARVMIEFESSSV